MRMLRTIALSSCLHEQLRFTGVLLIFHVGKSSSFMSHDDQLESMIENKIVKSCIERNAL